MVTGEAGLNISQRISAAALQGVVRVAAKGGTGGDEKTVLQFRVTHSLVEYRFSNVAKSLLNEIMCHN